MFFKYFFLIIFSLFFLLIIFLWGVVIVSWIALELIRFRYKRQELHKKYSPTVVKVRRHK